MKGHRNNASSRKGTVFHCNIFDSILACVIRQCSALYLIIFLRVSSDNAQHELQRCSAER